MEIPSKHLQQAVDAINTLPGIGKKTALRLALNLLRRKPEEVQHFAQSIADMKEHVKFCSQCGNLSDGDLCAICIHPKRDQSLICVVEDIRDVLAIESTQQYRGLYHVLGGIISPMDGIGPSNLNMASLVDRCANEDIKEVILALNSTMEGDTTSFYIFRKLSGLEVTISTLARGVSIGDEIQYADEITLGRSLMHRTPFEQTMSR
ncbi:MAG: recombination protein RecR [Flavobacteriales bacterium]|nr:recombination protein RecR [Flavobacteriales bacterium]